MLELRRTVVTVALLALPGLAGAWGDCDERAAREAGEDAAGVARVEVHARAGSLRVEGREGASRVTASGTACAEDREDLEQVQIRMSRSGDTLRIETEMPRGGDSRLDLEIAMPRGLELEIEDSSGELEVEGSGPTRIRDSSGSIEVGDVSGDLEVRDNSGSIDVHGVTGDVRVEDGSGSIEIDGVRGSVVIEDDGSGSIRISDVGQDVHVEEDGSGSIDVRDVGGSLRVDRDGSGGIRYSNVTGEVSVPHR